MHNAKESSKKLTHMRDHKNSKDVEHEMHCYISYEWDQKIVRKESGKYVEVKTGSIQTERLQKVT